MPKAIVHVMRNRNGLTASLASSSTASHHQVLVLVLLSLALRFRNE
jgi:hypothetical protein